MVGLWSCVFIWRCSSCFFIRSTTFWHRLSLFNGTRACQILQNALYQSATSSAFYAHSCTSQWYWLGLGGPNCLFIVWERRSGQGGRPTQRTLIVLIQEVLASAKSATSLSRKGRTTAACATSVSPLWITTVCGPISASVSEIGMSLFHY